MKKGKKNMFKKQYSFLTINVQAVYEFLDF